MRYAALTRVLPGSVLLLGLLLTLIVSTNVAARNERATAQARQAANTVVLTHARASESELHNVADEVDRLAHSLRVLTEIGDIDIESAVTAEVDAQLSLERRSAILAVFVQSGVDQVMIFSDDSIAGRDFPLVPAGLDYIDGGIWNGSLSYGIDTSSRAGAEIVILVDRDALQAAIQPSFADGFSATLYDLPGQESGSETAVHDGLESIGGVLWDRQAGSAVSRQDAEVLGHSVSIEVEAANGALWLPSSGVAWSVPLFGTLLSLLAAAAAMVTVRVVSRAELERDEADLARDAAAARFRASFERAPIGVIELDANGTIVAANPRFASQLGFAAEELLETELLDLVDGEDRPEAQELLWAMLEGETDGEQTERRYRNRNGGAVWVRESMSVLVSEDGSHHVLLQAEDVSDERRARAELHRKALFDDLTGLPNRSNLIARVNRALDADRPADDVLALMFVDLDKFKNVNDTLGHEAGDILLIEVAERLRRACRATDTVARLGGDEFVVLCEGLPNDEVASQTAERFAETLREPMFIRDVEVPVSASIGLVVESGAASSSDLLRQADQAMYRAKTSGRNQLIRFDIDEGTRRRTDEPDTVSAHDLRSAIDNGQLLVHYQPVVDTGTLEVVGCDAFIRWAHTERGLLTAGEFLPAVEKHGMVEELDRLALAEGVATLAEWAEDERSSWYMIFNLSPVNYDNREFAGSVATLIEEAGVDPSRVILERHETSFLTQTPTAVIATRELRSLGVRISLDHFGTGSSTLNEMSMLEFDVLKIDRSFVRDSGHQQTYVLEALGNMADALDLKVIAEGIETETELRVVQKAGLAFAQGYLLGKPVSEAQFVAGDFGRAESVAALSSSEPTGLVK